MKIILFVILYFTISLSTLKADNHIKTNPITTPMEPEAFMGAYTEMILKMASFQKVVLMLKHLNYLRICSCWNEVWILHSSTYRYGKKAGATQDEIKTAIMVAGVVSLNSTVMYGNQYNQEKWRKMFK